jgi:hypothetical protein
MAPQRLGVEACEHPIRVYLKFLTTGLIAAGAYWLKVPAYALAILHCLINDPPRRELKQPSDRHFSSMYQWSCETIMMCAGNGKCPADYYIKIRSLDLLLYAFI